MFTWTNKKLQTPITEQEMKFVWYQLCIVVAMVPYSTALAQYRVLNVSGDQHSDATWGPWRLEQATGLVS